jgi:hypothetical protein
MFCRKYGHEYQPICKDGKKNAVGCPQCMKINRKALYQENKEPQRAANRQWRDENPEKQDEYRMKRRPWKKFKKDTCEQCGFIPAHPAQLDVDHIDGNKENNDISNLQTLCANCHRLKTFLNKEYLSNRKAG